MLKISKIDGIGPFWPENKYSTNFKIAIKKNNETRFSRVYNRAGDTIITYAHNYKLKKNNLVSAKTFTRVGKPRLQKHF